MKTKLTQAQKEAQGRLALAKMIVTDAMEEALDLGLPGTAGLFRRIETRLVGNTADKINGAIRKAVAIVDARRLRLASVQADQASLVGRRAAAALACSVLADALGGLDSLVVGLPVTPATDTADDTGDGEEEAPDGK